MGRVAETAGGKRGAWAFAFPDGVTSASSQPAVVGDTLYVNSGYSAFGPGTSLSGNVLLAFTLRGN